MIPAMFKAALYYSLAVTMDMARDAMDIFEMGGKLGVQAIILLLLAGAVVAFWKSERERKAERKRFQETMEGQIAGLLETNGATQRHHEGFALQMQKERGEMNDERKANMKIVMDLQRETNAALNGNTMALNTLSAIVRDKL